MKLPRLDDPERYIDLFVVQFADGQVAVGYTAEEAATIAEQEACAEAKIFRIHDARPDGTVELVGVGRDRFSLEAGMFFGREAESPARADYEELGSLARGDPPPARCRLVLARWPDGRTPWVSGLIYPAEADHAMSRYLIEHRFAGGINVIGGVGAVTEFYASAEVVESEGLPSAGRFAPRDWEQLRRAMGETIQR